MISTQNIHHATTRLISFDDKTFFQVGTAAQVLDFFNEPEMKKIKIDYENALFADIDDLKLVDIQEKFNDMETKSSPSRLPVAMIQEYKKSLEKYDYFMNMFFNGQDVALKDVPKNLDTSHCTKGGSNFKF